MATPYFATEYTVNRLSLPELLRRYRIQMGYFESGHMMYLQLASLSKISKDLTAFIQESIPVPSCASAYIAHSILRQLNHCRPDLSKGLQ